MMHFKTNKSKNQWVNLKRKKSRFLQEGKSNSQKSKKYIQRGTYLYSLITKIYSQKTLSSLTSKSTTDWPSSCRTTFGDLRQPKISH